MRYVNISVSVHQRSSSFIIYLTASTTNGVVWLPITLQQSKSLFGTCIGSYIQPGAAYLLSSVLAFQSLRAFFLPATVHKNQHLPLHYASLHQKHGMQPLRTGSTTAIEQVENRQLQGHIRRSRNSNRTTKRESRAAITKLVSPWL